jgi:tripartite-type tricarboxylate transporter receptor subunit TctC
MPAAMVGSRNTAARVTPGEISLRSSSHFAGEKCYSSAKRLKGYRHETSPPQISACGRGCGRAAGRAADRKGASLSDAAGAVPYRGAGPALADLLGGQVEFMFAAAPSAIEYVNTGKLRALAVTTRARSEALKDVPTVAEFLPGFEASSWYGVGAPNATPAEIVDKLNKEINAGLADPKTKSRLAELGGAVLPGSPADFGKLVADETEKWGKVIRAANIKPE